MDKASRALAQGVPPSVPNLYRALTNHNHIARFTLYHRTRERRSIKEKATSQQYLTL
ncbi:hypothetical protein DL98DRAFT_442522 [Cadophora sp. DSE1049]|nr:hypothetical protein DL98DRAFT_442522 [Cadophora sp. DSE1049]